MAILFPTIENIQRLKVPATPGELFLVKNLIELLDDSYEVYFNPYLDGDRPDIIILKENCAAFVIEVKDWNLALYQVTEKNEWLVSSNSKTNSIASPQSQAFRYKKNLYDLHLPVVGLARLRNPNFFRLVHCFVYFHGSSRSSIDALYQLSESKNMEFQGLLNERYKNKEIEFAKYENQCLYLDRKRQGIQRDKAMSVGSDAVPLLVKKIQGKKENILFDSMIYEDFKRRLSPPLHVLQQGKPIDLDAKQLHLTISEDVKEKIKGVAGCGKTSILSQRAINARKRHETPVLILTFNITLKNYIRDKISDILGGRDYANIEISNYHQFYNAQLNNTGQNIAELIEKHGLEAMYSVDKFQDKETIRYKTILLDEIQDYEPEWVKIVRDNFLYSDSEMILFGDEAQDIYKREVGKAPVIAQGFGRWSKLNRSYRTEIDSPLNHIFKAFQEQYLIGRYPDTEVCATTNIQKGMNFNLLKCCSISSTAWAEEVFVLIKDYMSNYGLVPNDVVVLSSTVNTVRELNEYWRTQEKTHSMFETIEELVFCVGVPLKKLRTLDANSINTLVKENKDKVDHVRRVKKNHFYANTGLIKFSTVHSFKGLESKTVFYVLDENDSPEIVYTSITRSIENLVIISRKKDSPYLEFFNQAIA